MAEVHAWAAHAAKQKLEPYTFDPGPLGSEEVEIAVECCGLCHSDVSMIRETRRGVGRSRAWPDGWPTCRSGVERRNPLPDTLDLSSAGPLFCAGVTVFGPLSVFGVKPTDRVGVVGIGGLGHLALRFANAWGCEVTAFTSHDSKANEARGFGAHHVVSSRDSGAIRKLTGALDFLLVTVNVPLDWSAMVATLRPNGQLHVVGAIVEPLAISAMDLIFGQKRVSGSPVGAPAVIASMLDFAARHKIAPQVEHFPMSKVNEAVEHLMSGKARYRIILDPDFH